MKIGIIGQGFVGFTLYSKLKEKFDVRTYDIIKSKSNSTFKEIKQCDCIFICLPTPMDQYGACDTSILEGVIRKIDNINKLLVIKSTILPGTTQNFNEKFKSTFVFNPEFLREKHAISDFENQTHIILGGKKDITSKIKCIYKKVFSNKEFIETDSTTAEMVKYTINCFLAVKVSFANEIFRICDSLLIEYENVLSISKFDKRLGDSHWNVPGPDGDFGFGGHCLPKDLSAIINLTEKNNTINNVLKAALKTNNKIRKDRDWEKMVGRVIKKEGNK